jgi:glycolate oxidase iron-sulfur subunit
MTAAATKTPLPLAGCTPADGGKPLGANIDYEYFMDCVHCGLCLGSCPTYVETGNENDSPRGRIYLWRAVADGRAELSPEAQGHLNLCLECMACETACPSGVQYHNIIHSFKKDMTRLAPPAPTVTALQRFMLFNLTPFRDRMRLALLPVRILQMIGLGGLVRLGGKLLPKSLRSMQEIVPDLHAHHNLPEFLPAIGPRRAKVGLMLGCAQDAFFPQANLATALVLQHNGCDVVIPKAQGCCGALHAHAGLDKEAATLAKTNCHVFDKALGGLADCDAIINNAGGCGPVIKNYGHMLEGGDCAKEGSLFGKKAKDIMEFLAELGPVKPKYPLKLNATYHDACGLAHAQKIRSQPRQMLAMIEGLSLRPLNESEFCCGAAGSYNITQPEMSNTLGERKAKNVLETGAEAVLSGNVGCLLQMIRHIRDHKPNFWVAHPVEALAAAYTGKRPVGLRKNA